MNKVYLFLLLLVFMNKANAVFWTVKAESGVLVTKTGIAAINIGNFQPLSANPPDTAWIPCEGNWIYFHQEADGTPIDDKLIDRMLSAAFTAFKTDSYIRVGISRNADNFCYSSQIYDSGS